MRTADDPNADPAPLPTGSAMGPPASSARRVALRGAGGLALLPAMAWAGYPERPVRLVVSRPPGGVSDVIGRALARGLTEQVRQFVIVENVAGDRGAAGARAVAAAPPDGYTLLLADPGHLRVIAGAADDTPKLARDFVPLALAAVSALVLVVDAERIRADSMPALMKLAASRDAPLRMASPGPFAFSRLVGEEFLGHTGLRAVHEPATTLRETLRQLLEGRADLAFVPAGVALAQIQAGRLRPIGVTTRRPVATLPTVPPLVEHDARLLAPVWHAVAAPAGLPRDLRDRLQSAVVAARAEADFATTIAAVGANPAILPAAELPAFLDAQSRRWGLVAARLPRAPARSAGDGSR